MEFCSMIVLLKDCERTMGWTLPSFSLSSFALDFYSITTGAWAGYEGLEGLSTSSVLPLVH